MTDPERTDLDIRVDAEDRAGTMPDPAEGADITAHRALLHAVDREMGPNQPIGNAYTVVIARRLAVGQLVEAVDQAHDQWDPYAHVGSVAVGIVRALRDLGAVPR